MRVIRCLCGYEFNVSVSPDEGYILIKDTDYERLQSTLCELSRLEAKDTSFDDPKYRDLTNDEIHMTDERIYICPQCNRLIRYAFLRSNEIENYTLEKVTKYKNLHFEEE